MNERAGDYANVSSVLDDTHDFLNIAFIESSHNLILSSDQKDTPTSVYSDESNVGDSGPGPSNEAKSFRHKIYRRSKYQSLEELSTKAGGSSSQRFVTHAHEVLNSEGKSLITDNITPSATKNRNVSKVCFRSSPYGTPGRRYLPRIRSKSDSQAYVTQSMCQAEVPVPDEKSTSRSDNPEKEITPKYPYLPKLTTKFFENKSKSNISVMHVASDDAVSKYNCHNMRDEFPFAVSYEDLELACDEPQKETSEKFHFYHALNENHEVNSAYAIENILPALTDVNGISRTFEIEKSAAFVNHSNGNGLKRNFIPREASWFRHQNGTWKIRNRRIEELLQEAGVLEESDHLTFVPNEMICETLIKQNECGNTANSNEQCPKDSVSLLSFLQHEISCFEETLAEHN